MVVRQAREVGSAAGGVTSSGSARSTVALAGTGTLLVLMNYNAPLMTAPQTAAALDAGAAGTIWMISSISVGLAAALLVLGAFADNYGRRRAFVLGSVGLAVTMILGALAPNVWVFVGARIAQGVASAAIIVATQSLVAAAHPVGPSRSKALGFLGSMLGAGIALGPFASALGERLIGWSACYWFYAVAAIVLAVVGGRLLPESRAEHTRRADVPGALLLVGAVVSLLTAVTTGRQGWDNPVIIGLVVAAVVCAVAFVLVQRVRAEPLVDLQLFRGRLFVASTLGALVVGVAVIGLLSDMSAPLQAAYGTGPLVVSGVFFAWAGTSAVVAAHSHRLSRFLTGPRELALGLAICVVGELIMLGTVREPSVGIVLRLLLSMVVLGVGSGVVNAALVRLAVASVPAHRAAMGSGANNTARYIGSSLGVAITAVVLATGGGAIGNIDHAVLVAIAVLLVGAPVILLLTRGRPAGSTTT